MWLHGRELEGVRCSVRLLEPSTCVGEADAEQLRGGWSDCDSVVLHDEADTVSIARCMNLDGTTAAARCEAMLDGVLAQWLQQQMGHACAQHVRLDAPEEEKVVAEAGQQHGCEGWL